MKSWPDWDVSALWNATDVASMGCAAATDGSGFVIIVTIIATDGSSFVIIVTIILILIKPLRLLRSNQLRK